MDLKDCFVRLKGEIFPWGEIKISKGFPDKDTGDYKSGTSLWSEKLIRYGQGGYVARVSKRENIVVYRIKGDKRIVTIRSSELQDVDVSLSRVTCNGYLYDLKDLYILGGKEISFENQDQWARLFDSVNAGGGLLGIDNSSYVRVSPNLCRIKVRVISNWDEKKVVAVLTEEGKLLSFVEHSPFSERNLATQGFSSDGLDFLDDDSFD